MKKTWPILAIVLVAGCSQPQKELAPGAATHGMSRMGVLRGKAPGGMPPSGPTGSSATSGGTTAGGLPKAPGG
jgi:hypothetical protein